MDSNRLQDVVRGMEAAQAAIREIADGNERAALGILDRTTEGEAKWAAAALLSGIREAVFTVVKKDPRRLELALKAAANGMSEDIFTTGLAVLLDDAERNS